MKTDKNGCSICPKGQENYETFTTRRGSFVQYDFRAMDGELFSCVRKTLEECRAARNFWEGQRRAKAQDPIALSCLLDDCPLTHKPVDMRKCCGVHCAPCPHYGAEPWSQTGKVTCKHPEAKPCNEAERNTRSEAFKATAGVAHLTEVSF